MAEEGVRPQRSLETQIEPKSHLPPDYKTMGQELLDLHRTHTQGVISAEEYETAKASILRKFED